MGRTPAWQAAQETRSRGSLRWLVAVLLSVALAAAAEPSDFEGAWKLDPDRTENLEQAIEKALETESFVTRMMAKGRILKSAKIPQTLAISLSGETIQLSTELQTPPAVLLGGAPVIWMRPKGPPVKMRMAMSGGHLVQTVEGDFVTRIQRFTLSSDRKSLLVDVEVASVRLARKITYRAGFVRSLP